MSRRGDVAEQETSHNLSFACKNGVPVARQDATHLDTHSLHIDNRDIMSIGSSDLPVEREIMAPSNTHMSLDSVRHGMNCEDGAVALDVAHAGHASQTSHRTGARIGLPWRTSQTPIAHRNLFRYSSAIHVGLLQPG